MSRVSGRKPFPLAALAMAGALAGLAGGGASIAAPPPPEPVSFVKDIKPLLEKSCVGCHGPVKAKSGYRLDIRAGALKGGEIAESKSAAGIVPKKSGESLLVTFVSATAKDDKNAVYPMPPKDTERLTKEQIELLKRWIDEGAAWPDGVTLTPPPKRGRG